MTRKFPEQSPVDQETLPFFNRATIGALLARIERGLSKQIKNMLVSIFSIFLTLAQHAYSYDQNTGSFYPFDNSEFSTAMLNTPEKGWLKANNTIMPVTAENLPSYGMVMRVDCGESMDRCVYDKKFNAAINLQNIGEIHVEVYVDDPVAMEKITLYFTENLEWKNYFDLTQSVTHGLQTLVFPISKFVKAGQPSWANINAMRFSAWNATNSADRKSTTIRVKSIRAIPRASVVVVYDDKDINAAAQNEDDRLQLCDSYKRLSNSCHEQLSHLLNNGFVKHNKESVKSLDENLEKWTEAKILIIPHNTTLTGTSITKINNFVSANGGFLVAFGKVDPGLSTILGFTIGSKTSDQNSFEFIQTNLVGIPAKIQQASLPPYAVSSVNPQNVVAKWMNQIPAWIRFPRGYYMSSHLHYQSSNDSALTQAKSDMLVTLLANLSPEIGISAAQQAKRSYSHVGKYNSIEESRVQVLLENTPENTQKIVENLLLIDGLELDHNTLLNQNNYTESISTAKKIEKLLEENYALSQQSTSNSEFRGVWSHDSKGPYSGDWNKAIAILKDNGFNAVISNISGAGFAHYASDNVDLQPTSNDQLRALIDAAHEKGIKVHAWDMVWNLYKVNDNFYNKLVSENRLMAEAKKQSDTLYSPSPLAKINGETSYAWISPCHDANREYKKRMILEIADKYEVDGIHLDYIRINGEMTMYEEGCKQRFIDYALNKQITVNTGNWPSDVITNKDAKKIYADFQRETITSFVKEIKDGLIAINQAKILRGHPEVILSAAVHPLPDYARRVNAQDWQDWVTRGLVDQIHPMSYTDNRDIATFDYYLMVQSATIPSNFPVYPGIGTVPYISVDTVIDQINLLRNGRGSVIKPSKGFTLYNFNQSLAEQYLPLLSKKVTASKIIKKIDDNNNDVYDDGEIKPNSWNGSGCFYGDESPCETSNSGNYFGVWGGIKEYSGIRFRLNSEDKISGNIQQAKLVLTANGTSHGDPKIRIFAENSNNCGIWESSHKPSNLVQLKTQADKYFQISDLDYSNFDDDTRETKEYKPIMEFDITNIIQELANSSGWTGDEGAICLVIEPLDDSGVHEAGFIDFYQNALHAPELHIQY